MRWPPHTVSASATAETQTAVVGAGFAGLLVARELLRAGKQVTLIERGGLKRHADQLRDGAHELDLPTTEHTHEVPAGEEYPWDYVQGIGGGSPALDGCGPSAAALRLRPALELRSGS